MTKILCEPVPLSSTRGREWHEGAGDSLVPWTLEQEPAHRLLSQDINSGIDIYRIDMWDGVSQLRSGQ
ncbi:MAG: hypothetical protein JWM11_4228 [Planctomycetaceae bacterium]|nr:hypothetical protein [Planctomycetaceae bacterium]